MREIVDVVEVISQKPETVYALLCHYPLVAAYDTESGGIAATTLCGGIPGEPGAVWSVRGRYLYSMVMVEAIPRKRITYMKSDQMPRVSDLADLASFSEGKHGIIFELDDFSSPADPAVRHVRLTVSRVVQNNCCECCAVSPAAQMFHRRFCEPLFAILENPPANVLAMIASNVPPGSSSSAPPGYAETMKE